MLAGAGRGPGSAGFLARHDLLIPLFFFLVFLAIALPGISWGAPDVWHPDEVVVRSIKALHGEWVFDEINFDYPSLPQYAMFWLGKAVLALGKTDKEVLILSRVLSAILAGSTLFLTYRIAVRISGNIYIGGLADLLLISVSELAHNGRFAHNDTYLAFFVTLAILFLVNYRIAGKRGWLYASFVCVGMAASSKYNGISLVLAPVVVYLAAHRKQLFTRPLRHVETLSLGFVLTFLGFAVGTPKSLLWMSYYFKRVMPALQHTANFARQPDSVRGLLGQFSSLAEGIGLPLLLVFLASVAWGSLKLVRAVLKRQGSSDPKPGLIAVLLVSLLALDIPIMVSYNYPTRFFLSMMPVLAALGSLAIADGYAFLKQKYPSSWKESMGVVLAAILLFSFARNISIMLLFLNDARFPASEFLRTLPAGTSLEHTYYPPSISQQFEREHNYPIHFIKSPLDSVPVNKKLPYNAGEAGLVDRGTDYFVVDDFTAVRFNDPYICETMQVECGFFRQLAAGGSAHYRLLANFRYALPWFLPQIKVTFVNPEIWVYERVK